MNEKIRTIKDVATDIKFWYSVVKILIGVITGLGIALPTVGGIVQKIVTTQVTEIITVRVPEIVREEIKPVIEFLYSDLGRMIEKNVKKIADNPEDIKSDDIRFIIERWPVFKNYYPGKAPLYDPMVIKLNTWYIEQLSEKKNNS